MTRAGFIADAHEDIAWACLDAGRDFVVAAPNVSLHLPAWRAGGVRLVCGTIFAADEKDPAGARARGLAQLEWYDLLCAARAGEVARARKVADLTDLGRPGPVRIVHLIEGGEPVADPDDLAMWRGRGTVAIGPVWNIPNRYGGGTHQDRGLTDAGRALVRTAGTLGMAVDLSHSNRQGFADVLAAATGPVYASHSNAAVLCPHRRNLDDGQIRELGDRGGVMGLVGYAPFVVPGSTGAVPLDAYLGHVEHVARLIGPSRVCLGSDYDGGFGPEKAIEGIPTAAEFPRLGDALRARGWPEADVHGFLGENLTRFVSALLPA